MAIENFDRYILSFPELDREKDFLDFWEKSTSEVKGVPIEPALKKNSKKSAGGMTCYDVTYRGYDRSSQAGELYVPHGDQRWKLAMLIHDYNTLPEVAPGQLDNSMAYFAMTLRGHASLPVGDEEAPPSPGYMIENIHERENYYVKKIYLDTLRAIEMLRLVKSVDSNTVGIIGRGLGAACAVFAASFSERVKALVLDAPSFCELPLSQNMVSSDMTREINEFIAASKTGKKQIKKNLSYFDALNFSDMIRVPVLAVCGIKDRISPAECVFGLFNRLMCDKTIEVYPEEGHEAGGKKQYQKSLKWIRDTLEVLQQ